MWSGAGAGAVGGWQGLTDPAHGTESQLTTTTEQVYGEEEENPIDTTDTQSIAPFFSSATLYYPKAPEYMLHGSTVKGLFKTLIAG